MTQSNTVFDSRSVQDLFLKQIPFTSLGIKYHRAYHTIYESSQVIAVEVLIDRLMRGAGQRLLDFQCGKILDRPENESRHLQHGIAL